MNDLRRRVIRLAHENPELRQHLLPILRTATEDPWAERGDRVVYTDDNKKSPGTVTQVTWGGRGKGWLYSVKLDKGGEIKTDESNLTSEK